MDEIAKRLGPRWTTVLAGIGVLGLGAMDELTGSELSFSIFYLAPVAVAAWYVGRRAGTAMCFLAAATWLAADLLAGQLYSHTSIAVWNASVRLGFFLVVVRLLIELKERLDTEVARADTDHLTGLANTSGFLRRLEWEVARARRYGHPFSLAYVDLDNFKTVNDRWGHATGDRVLREVGESLRSGVRETDVPARLGGDEFALLLPETDGAAARELMPVLRNRLLDVSERGGWPVGFSAGVVSFAAAPRDAEEAIRLADELMYEAKRGGKGDVRFLVAGGPSGP